MSEYKSLKVLSYNKDFDIAKEEKLRKNLYTTMFTGLSIKPIKNGNFIKEIEYELFCNPIKEINEILEDLYNTSNRIRKDYFDSTTEVLSMFLASKIIVNEIQSTNEIEGVQSTKKEIQETMTNTKKEGRFVSILSMYLGLLNEVGSSNILNSAEDVRTIYDNLFINNGEYCEIDSIPDGKIFRKEQIYIENNGKRVHTGVYGEDKLIYNINRLIDFNKRRDINSLIKYCIFHYYLEYNHPFYDGNGRIGRFLLSLGIRDTLDIFTALSVSYGVNFNKKAYNRIFKEVSDKNNFGEITLFVLELLKIIKVGQENIEQLMKKTVYDIERYTDKINEKADISEDEKRVLLTYMKITVIDDSKELFDKHIQEYVLELEQYKISKKNIKNILLKLEEKGYIEVCKKKPKVHKLILDKI